MDSSPVTQLPQKLDSDSILSTERSKSILSVPEIDNAPKSSLSDSKLAVDYFNASENEILQQSASPQSLSMMATESSPSVTHSSNRVDTLNPSDSHYSLCVRSESEERLKQEVSCFFHSKSIVSLKKNIRYLHFVIFV